MAMLMGITAIGTISYDEFDNGFPFLFSLPVDCKTYVAGKFILVFFMELIGIIYGAIIMFVLAMVTGKPVETEGLLGMVLVTFLIMAIVCSTMIYIQLKFGSERSRTVMLIIYGLIAVAAFRLKSQADKLMPVFEGLISTLSRMSPRVLTCAGVMIAGRICYSIYLITVKMMNKKEF